MNNCDYNSSNDLVSPVLLILVGQAELILRPPACNAFIMDTQQV